MRRTPSGRRSVAISRFERADHLQRVGADAHHDDAADGFARAVPVGGAAADLRPEAHARDVAEPDRACRPAPTVTTLCSRSASVLDVAAPAQHVLAAGQLEHARADFRVGVAHGSRDVGQREPEADQPVGVDDDLVLALESAERGDLRHAGHRLQRRADGEVLQARAARRDPSVRCRPSGRTDRPSPTPLASGPSVGETPGGSSCCTRPSCSSTRVRAQ